MNNDIGFLLYVAYALMGGLVIYLGWEFLKIIYYVINFFASDKAKKEIKEKNLKYKQKK